jgi:hypothetical protein
MSPEDYLFGGVMLVYLVGFVLSYFLHQHYWKRRHAKMSPFVRGIYITLIVIAGILFAGLVYVVFKNNTLDTEEIILRMIQMFIASSVFFSMIYFLLYISGKHEFGRADQDIKLAQTLYGKYFQMIYLSVITFFTVGFSDLMPFSLSSRLVNFIQIVMADMICIFLYSRSKYVFGNLF